MNRSVEASFLVISVAMLVVAADSGIMPQDEDGKDRAKGCLGIVVGDQQAKGQGQPRQRLVSRCRSGRRL